MKRGVLNYSMTWKQNGEKCEELFFNKMSAIRAYIGTITRNWERPYHDDGISELRLLEIYNSGRIEDITGKVNSFLEH